MAANTRGAATAQRIGVFGGTFDPPHLGHLAIAEWAREQLDLERVVFVPSGLPPHKIGRVRSPVAARLAMTRLAIRGNPGFEVSAIEARSEGPSFTVDTLAALRRRRPNDALFLIIGDDSLREFGTWRRPEAIVEMATLAVAGRPRDAAARSAANATAGGRWRRAVVRLDNPGIAVSSSAIRQRARAGRSIRYLVPDPVARYIVHHDLYRSSR